MNIIQIAGHLGADPETRFTPSGQKVTTLRVGARSRRKNKKDQGGGGEGRDREEDSNEDTIWWRVTVWGDRFDKMMTFLKKGSAIVAIGELHKPEIWTNKEGQPQVNMELTADILRFSPFGRSDKGEQPQHAKSGDEGRNTPYSGQPQQALYGQAPKKGFDSLDEDPPF